MRIANDVARDEWIFRVAKHADQASFRRVPHGAIDLLRGGLPTEVNSEIDDGTVRDRNPQRVTIKLPHELRDYKTNRARGASRRRNDRHRGGAGAPQVLVRQIEDALIVGVGMNRGHEALPD